MYALCAWKGLQQCVSEIHCSIIFYDRMGNSKSSTASPLIDIDKRRPVGEYLSQKLYKTIWKQTRNKPGRIFPVNDDNAVSTKTNDCDSDATSQKKELDQVLADCLRNKGSNYSAMLMDNFCYDISTKSTFYDSQHVNKKRKGSPDKYEVSSYNPIGIFENPEHHSRVDELNAALKNIHRHENKMARDRVNVKNEKSSVIKQPLLRKENKTANEKYPGRKLKFIL